MKGIIYKLKTKGIRFVSERPLLSIFIVCMILFLLFEYLPFLIKIQEGLENLSSKILGALFLLIVVELFLRIRKKASFPKTKEFVYGQIGSVLNNYTLDLFQFLNIDDKIEYKMLFNNDALIEFYNTYCEANRDKIENRYLNLTDNQVMAWYHSIEEQRVKLGYYFENALIINTRDDDLRNLLILNDKLLWMELELKKTKVTREKNKTFFSSYVCLLTNILKDIVNTGLYEYWCIAQHPLTVMERTQY